MTFLQLVQRLSSESGAAGSGPTAVVGQTGEAGRFVNWIADAYREIQDSREDWDFLRGSFTFNTVASTQGYAKSTVTNLSEWRVTKSGDIRAYLASAGVSDEQYLTYVKWNQFQERYLFGAERSVEDRPTHFTIKPDKSILFWPTPDAIYTINGEFYRTAYEFTADADEPIFDKHHLVIMYNALMRYSAYVSEPALYSKAELEYKKLYRKIVRDYTSDVITLGRSLV